MSAPPNGKGPRRHWAPLGTPEGNGVLTGLGTALAGVVPLLALLALAYLSARDQVARETDIAVRLAVRNAEHVFDWALADLNRFVQIVNEAQVV